MELSKRALGFLSRQYRVILTQNHLANALGTCTLSALLCATVCATAAFVAPTDALAGTANGIIAGVTLSPETESWSSTGDISANTTTNAPAYGIMARPTGPLSLTLNSGHTLNVTSVSTNAGPSAASAGIAVIARRPIRAEAVTAPNITITNDGTINASDTIMGQYGSTEIYGIIMHGDVTSTITNNGAITITSTGDTSRDTPSAIMSVAKDSTIINNGTINGTATVTTPRDNAAIQGLFADGNTNTLTNVGSVTLSATAFGDNAEAVIRGMTADGTTNNITNAGSIKLSSTTTGYASFAAGIGMSANSNANTIINEADGHIEISASGESAEAIGMLADTSDRIYDSAMDSPSEQVSTLVNKGTITVTATGQSTGDHTTAHGMLVMRSAQNTLTNHGTLNVSATTTGAEAANICLTSAYGMHVAGQGGNVTNLNNFGTINVSATGNHTNAFQAFIQSGTANVGTWALKLGEKYGTKSDTDRGAGYYVFGVGENGALNFGLDGKGAEFIISDLSGFTFGQEYKISDMIFIADGGTATGYIESVTSPSEFLKLQIVDAGTADDYTDQSIKGTVNITKANSPTHGAAMMSLAGATGHMNGLTNVLDGLRDPSGGAGGAGADMHAKSDTATMYADASTTFTDAGGSYISPESPLWKAFLMPFYSTTSAHSGAYNTDMGGLVMGANRNINDAFVFGFHASLAKTDSASSSSSSAAMDSDTMSYAFGLNGVYNIDKNLYVRGQLTGFFAENDFTMQSGTGALAQTASANIDTYGVYAKLAAGYDFALAPAHVLTPELGLSYMYAHMEGFDSTFVGNFGSTAFGMDSENYDALYADASLRWTGAFDLGHKENGSSLGTLKPTVKAGIRQALTDPEVSSTMNIFGTSATTHSNTNETSFVSEAGLAWIMDDVTLSATYTGEFGDVDNSHMGMFKVEWKF